MSTTTAPPVAPASSDAVRGLVTITVPLLPFALYAWLWAAFDASGTLGALAASIAMLALIAAVVVYGWRSTDAAAVRLGGQPQVWAFRRAARKGLLPAEGVGDSERWRAEVARQLRSTEDEVAGAMWLWLVGLVLAVPVAVAWAAGLETWRVPAYLPLALVVGWPLVRWDAARRRDRLRRLADLLPETGERSPVGR